MHSARAMVRAAVPELDDAAAEQVLREWEALLVRRVGTIVGRSILGRVLAQRAGGGRTPAPADLPAVLDGLVGSASVFFSKRESAGFAVALAESAAAVARGRAP